MMNHKMLLLICLALSFNLFAKEISLSDAQNLAKKQNRSMKNSEYSLRSAEWQKKNALTQFFPKITLNETAVRFDKEQIIMPSFTIGAFTIPESKMPKQNYTTELNINQTLFTGGKLFLNYRISNLLLKQSALAGRISEQDIELFTAGLYFQILKINDLISLMEESRKSYKDHYDKALIKQKNGTALMSEVLQWKLKYEESESTVKSLNNTKSVLLQSWKLQLGLNNTDEIPVPSIIQISDFLPEIKELNNLNDSQRNTLIQETLTKSKINNNNLKSIKLSKKILDNSILMSKTDFLPTLALNYNYQFENDNKLNFSGYENWKIIAYLSVPLFNSGSVYTSSKMKEFEIKKQLNELENYEDQTDLLIRKTQTEKFDLADKINTDITNLELANENKRQISQLLNQGMLTFNEQMDSELLYLSVYTAYISDIYDYLYKRYELINLSED
jgi:outer membrane protein TolC